MVLALFWVASRLVVRVLRPRLARIRGESLAQVLTSILGGVIKAIGFLVFLAVVFPSVNVGTMLGAGGALALAAGFAFRDIFENLLAGLLLLMRQPFVEGDVVEVEGVEGIVEAITIRETLVRRFDRQLVQIPNATVYKGAIRVQTDRTEIMTTVVLGVSYGDDLQQAEDVAVAAMRSVDGVLDDPAPEALYTEFGDSSINLDLRYFHRSAQHDLLVVRGEVVKAIKRAFDEHDLDIPFPITTLDAMGDVAAAARTVAGRVPARTGTGDGDSAD